MPMKPMDAPSLLAHSAPADPAAGPRRIVRPMAVSTDMGHASPLTAAAFAASGTGLDRACQAGDDLERFLAGTPCLTAGLRRCWLSAPGRLRGRVDFELADETELDRMVLWNAPARLGVLRFRLLARSGGRMIDLGRHEARAAVGDGALPQIFEFRPVSTRLMSS